MVRGKGAEREGMENKYGARAVKELRDGSSVSMVLGLGIVTFDLLDLGLHAYSIRRYTPGLLSGALEGGEVEIGELEKQILPLIFMDRCNCLVRWQVPIFQLQSSQTPRGGDDRYISLSASLFLLLYNVS